MAFFLPAAAGAGIGTAAIILAIATGVISLAGVIALLSNLKLIIIIVAGIMGLFLAVSLFK